MLLTTRIDDLRSNYIGFIFRIHWIDVTFNCLSFVSLFDSVMCQTTTLAQHNITKYSHNRQQTTKTFVTHK